MRLKMLGMVEGVPAVALDFDDLELDDAARRLDVGDLAECLAEQALADGGFHGNLLLGEVGFVFGHQRVGHLLAVADVLDGDPAEDEGLGGVDLGLVDDAGAGEDGFRLGDLGLEHALGLLGRVVLGVLAEVALVAGLGDLLGNGRPLHSLHVVQLVLELLEPFRGVVGYVRHGGAVFGLVQWGGKKERPGRSLVELKIRKSGIAPRNRGSGGRSDVKNCRGQRGA